MPVSLRRSFSLGGERFDDIHFINDATHNPAHRDLPGYGWDIEVPAVVRLLDAVKRGDATAEDALHALTEAVTFTSGCCWHCDQAAPVYDEALRRYDRRMQEWEREQETVTPESHPYLVGKSGKIHTLECGMAGDDPNQPCHPGRTLHEFAVNYDGHGGLYFGMDHFERSLAGMPERSSFRMTPEQIAERMNRSRKDMRCKVCQPQLPAAWISEASGHPGVTP